MNIQNHYQQYSVLYTRNLDNICKNTSEWKIFGTVHGPVQVKTHYRLCHNNKVYHLYKGLGIESLRGKIFLTGPDRPCVPHSFIYNGY
jgi:hypothetical protein